MPWVSLVPSYSKAAHSGSQVETRGFTGLLASSFPLHYTEVSVPHLCGKTGNFLAEPLLTPPNSLLLYALRAARRQIRSQNLYIDAIDRPNKNLENVGITLQNPRFPSPRPALRDGVTRRVALKAARLYPAFFRFPVLLTERYCYCMSWAASNLDAARMSGRGSRGSEHKAKDNIEDCRQCGRKQRIG